MNPDIEDARRVGTGAVRKPHLPGSGGVHLFLEFTISTQKWYNFNTVHRLMEGKLHNFWVKKYSGNGLSKVVLSIQIYG